VHLGLAARRRLEADSHLLGRLWPHLAYVVAKLRVAARIAQSPDLLQQPDRREGGIGEKALADDLLEGIELLGHRSSSFVAGRLAQVAIQLACGDPASNRAAVDPEQFRNGGLAQSLLEVMSQQHASLQSDQVRLHRVGESARCTIGRESVYAPPLRLPATTSEPGGTFSSAKGGKFSTAGNTPFTSMISSSHSQWAVRPQPDET